jgi:ArsR family transcriptional regulator, arsenate/arsenite/antimonite-responsive transcriptional repressor
VTAPTVSARPPLIADLAACCSPVTGGVLDTPTAERLAAVLKALAEPTRLRLVSLTDPVNLTQPTVSHHLKILVEAGLLTREQRGKWAYYRLVDGALDALAALLTRQGTRSMR